MKQIGSDYHLLNCEVERLKSHSEIKDNLDGFEEDTIFLSTCRSAIEWILTNEITPLNKKVLLPGFMCHSVLEPCKKAGYSVYPYPITDKLKVNWSDFQDLINFINPGAVILHSYFGFNTLEDGYGIIEGLLNKGVTIIEDRTQSLFSSFSINSSFKVGSIRKWLPVPDGAFINGSKYLQELEQDNELANSKLKALTAKADYLVNGVGDSNKHRQLFAEAEALLDSRKDIFRMHDMSILIYQNTDINSLKQKRRDNYHALYERLSKQSELVLPLKLKEGIVPFHMPVLIRNKRKEFQQHLAKNGIYATIIWACPEEFKGKLDETTQSVFDNIICFHCDQRYDIDDMNRIGDVVADFFK